MRCGVLIVVIRDSATSGGSRRRRPRPCRRSHRPRHGGVVHRQPICNRHRDDFLYRCRRNRRQGADGGGSDERGVGVSQYTSRPATSEADDRIDDENHRPESRAPWKAWLDKPLSPGGCALGWLASTAVFVAIVQLFGGPAPGDAVFSTPSTWAIVHGQLGCAFPPGHILIAPVYPFLSGGVAAIAHIGYAVPFPARTALGPHCDSADSVISGWSVRAGALTNTLRVGYVGWLALLGGIVSFLRASGRGRCGWEPATLLAAARLPPVWSRLVEYFHPQDLVAMGLALGRWRALGATRGSQLASSSPSPSFLSSSPSWSWCRSSCSAPAMRRRTFLVAASATAVLAILLLVDADLIRSSGLGVGGYGEHRRYGHGAVHTPPP